MTLVHLFAISGKCRAPVGRSEYRPLGTGQTAEEGEWCGVGGDESREIVMSLRISCMTEMSMELDYVTCVSQSFCGGSCFSLLSKLLK